MSYEEACIAVESMAEKQNRNTYDLQTKLGRVQRSIWLSDLLPQRLEDRLTSSTGCKR